MCCCNKSISCLRNEDDICHASSYWTNLKTNCVSKFYCTTSTSLEKCEGCCGKCSDDLGESSSNSDIDTESSTESDEISETPDESSAENSSESEDHFDFVST